MYAPRSQSKWLSPPVKIANPGRIGNPGFAGCGASYGLVDALFDNKSASAVASRETPLVHSETRRKHSRLSIVW
jgi:hypothetical protein